MKTNKFQLANITIPRFILFVLAYLLVVAGLCIQGQNVNGPHVFADETSYFNHIFRFANGDSFDPTQYGPLYPYLASLVFDLNNIVLSYENIRLFNILVFSASLFPLFLLFLELGLTQLQAFVLCLASVVRPWSSLTAQIWAEPLIFFLYCIAWILIVRYFRNPTVKRMLFLSFVFGLLSLTKQAGSVVAIGFYLVTLYDLFQSGKNNLKKNLARVVIGISTFAAIFVSYVIYCKTVAGSSIGYGNVTSTLSERIFTVLLSSDFYNNFFHQLSYITVGCFFLGMTGVILYLSQWRKLDREQMLFVLVLGVTTVALSLIIAAFNNTMDQSYKIANMPDLAIGRYLAPLIPVWLAIGFKGIESFSLIKFARPWYQSVSLALLATLIPALLVGLFSPLKSSWAHGIVNAPDVMYLIRLLRGINAPWGQSEAFSIALSDGWRVAAWGFVAAALCLYAYRTKLKDAVLAIILLLSIYSGVVSFQNVEYYASSSQNESHLFRTLLKSDIPLAEVGIVSKSGSVLNPFMVDFWLLSKAKDFMRSEGQTDSNKSYLISKEKMDGPYENLIPNGRIKLYHRWK